MDPRLAACLDDLRSGDEDRVERAIVAIDGLGAAAVPDLLELVRDADERVRAAALGAAARHGDGSPATVRAILRGAQAALRAFEDPGAGAEVHDAVLSLSEPVAALLPGLLREAGDGDPEVRLAAARDLESLTHFLGAAGGDEGEVVAVLVASIADPEPRVRWWAAGALGNLAGDPERSVPALVAALDDPEGVVRMAAVESLERFGRAAGAALPSLLRSPRAGDPALAARSLLAAARVGGGIGAVHDALATALADPAGPVRGAACAALGELGAAPRTTREALAAAARDPDEEVRGAAAWALTRIRAIQGA